MAPLTTHTNQCVDVCTDDPCNNERTQLSMDYGCVNVARFLSVRLFKCSDGTERESGGDGHGLEFGG